MLARDVQDERVGARSAQIIPFPKSARQIGIDRLVRAMDGVVVALRDQLAEVRRFQDNVRALDAGNRELEASLKLYQSRLQTVAVGAGDIRAKSLQLAARMEICRRRLSG